MCILFGHLVLGTYSQMQLKRRESMFYGPTGLPTMPDAVTGVGAVALPDGRVLICGGVIVEVEKGGVVSLNQRKELLGDTSEW